MAAEWREIRLGDLVKQGVLLISDGYRVRNEELGPTGIPFVRGGDIRDGWINTDTEDHIRPELRDRVAVKMTMPGDVAFITKGTVGRAGRLRSNQPPVVFAPQVAYWRVMNLKVLEPDFLFYLIRSREFQAALDGVKTHGSMVADYVSISQQHDFRFHIPDIRTQRAIAQILSALDEKIELNRRMSETLEALGRAIFKSWFVDFDPVCAKAEGRDTGLPASIASLFPDRLQECELGRIPTGWETYRLGDLLDLDKGLSYKGQFLSHNGIPMVNLGCFLGHGRFAEQAIKNYSGEFQSRHTIRPGDLVLANTDLTQKREVIGSPALVPPRDDLDDLIFSHHVYAARFHEGKEPWKLFVYFLLLQDGFRERAMGFATGTTVLALPRDAVTDLSCPAVPLPLLQAFDSLALPLIHAQWQSMKQSRILAAMRDALLPKLISGKLRVPNADSVVGLS